MNDSEKEMILLAIESSCDDTSAAIISNGNILANITASQAVHEQYGGVVPELASRAHQQNIVPVVDIAIKKAGINVNELSGIAVTEGPGLLGSLLVGTSFAKSMAQSLNIPIIGIDHMDAHVMAHFIDNPKPEFPFLCLVVSGGHTQIVLMKNIHHMEIIGKTQDDAAGEAFDKTAKILGLPYPGGPLIDRLAKQGDSNKFQFATSKMPGYDFSFSGLKTSILYLIQNEIKKDPDFIEKNLNHICASVQKTIINYLLKQLERAANDLKIKHIGIAGGVSANSSLRDELSKLGLKNNWHIYIPDFQYCTDNAGMIAITAHYKFINKDFSNINFAPYARNK